MCVLRTSTKLSKSQLYSHMSKFLFNQRHPSHNKRSSQKCILTHVIDRVFRYPVPCMRGYYGGMTSVSRIAHYFHANVVECGPHYMVVQGKS
jgi:hypothetical protein